MRTLQIAAILIACAAACRADDWPRWRGPDNTGRVASGAAVPATLSATPAVAWSQPLGPGVASPVVAGDRVFVTDAVDQRETVHALDAATGAEVWKAAIGPVYVDFQTTPGPRCPPLVDGDRVYLQTGLGEFQCRNAARGDMIWRCSFQSDFGAPAPREAGQNLGGHRHGNTGTPVIDGDRIYVAAGGPQGASLVCMDKRTGKVIWKSQDDPPGHNGPVVATIAGVRQVIAFTAIALIGVDAGTGALLWRVPLRTTYGRHVMTPVVYRDTVIVGSNVIGLVGIRVARSASGFTAERAWTNAALAVNFSCPVADGEHLYGLGPSNALFCARMRTGETVWAKDTVFTGAMRTGFAAFIWAGRNLMAFTDTGELMLLAADPAGVRQIGRATVCGKNWCHPAYAGGRLYVRDDRELRCVRLAP